MNRRSLLIVAVVAVLPIMGCGQSKEEKAKETVCAKSSEVASTVRRLATLPASQLDGTYTALLSQMATIGVQLKLIRDALGELDPAKARELRAAEEEFRVKHFGQVTVLVIGAGATRDQGLQDDIARELDKLDTGWRRTMAPATERWCR